LQTAKSVKRTPEFIAIFCFGTLGSVRGWFEITFMVSQLDRWLSRQLVLAFVVVKSCVVKYRKRIKRA